MNTSASANRHDGIPRVVSLTTLTGFIRRAINRLLPLPISTALAPEDDVYISNGLSPSLSSPIARVVELIPGHDGIPRVASLKTPTGFIRRAINRLLPLPISAAVAPEDGSSIGCQQMANLY